MKEPKKLLTVEDVARVLDVQPQTVRGLISSGELKGFKISPGDATYAPWRVTAAALKNFIDARKMAKQKG